MGLMMLLNAEASGIMWLTLLGAVLLTWWECHSTGFDWRRSLWWVSLVLLIHVFGYLALRVWLAVGRRDEVVA